MATTARSCVSVHRPAAGWSVACVALEIECFFWIFERELFGEHAGIQVLREREGASVNPARTSEGGAGLGG